jgi:hypothetical protein
MVSTRSMKRTNGIATSGNNNSKKRRAATNKKNEKKSGASFFNDHDLIAPLVVQFLDAKTLVPFARFARTNKDDLLNPEVARRKAKFIELEQAAKEQIGQEPDIITLANVEAVRKLREQAVNLIGVPITNGGTRTLFREEREKLSPPTGMRQTRSPLCMLPLCFYLPSVGDPFRPDARVLEAARRRALWLWGAEDHGFHSGFFGECMMEVAFECADNPHFMEAFRIAARECVLRAPAALQCMQFTLAKVDEIKNEEHFDENEDGELENDEE